MVSVAPYLLNYDVCVGRKVFVILPCDACGLGIVGTLRYRIRKLRIYPECGSGFEHYRGCFNPCLSCLLFGFLHFGDEISPRWVDYNTLYFGFRIKVRGN